MPKRMPGKKHAKRGRAKLWFEYSPWWIRHPVASAKLLERNARYFEQKAAALRNAAKAFRELSAGSYTEEPHHWKGS